MEILYVVRSKRQQNSAVHYELDEFFTTIRSFDIESCDVWHLFARITIFNWIMRHLNFFMQWHSKTNIKYERFVISFMVVFSTVLHFLPHIFSFEKITCIIMTYTTHYYNANYKFGWRAFEVSKEQPLTSNLYSNVGKLLICLTSYKVVLFHDFQYLT